MAVVGTLQAKLYDHIQCIFLTSVNQRVRDYF